MSLKRYPARSRTLYSETFNSGVGAWGVSANASGVSRSTSLDAGVPGAGPGCLTWTATTSGNTAVTTTQIATPPSLDLLGSARLAIGGTGTFSARLNLDWYTSGGGYLNGDYNWSRAAELVADGATFWALPCATKLPSNAGFVQMTLTVFSATAGQAFYLDNALLTY